MRSQKQSKRTCHFFNEETGDFLFARDIVPECDKDLCDACGDCLVCTDKCKSGAQHYWAQYIAD